MKSAIELAMEKFGPLKELSTEQKEEISEIDKKYQSKITSLKVQLQNYPEPKDIKERGLRTLFKLKTLKEIDKLNAQCENEKNEIRSKK